jgi:hypothetical protein
MDVECVRLPEVPEKVIVGVDAAAPGAAVSVVLCALPGVRERVAGFAVTPDGSLVIATVTVAENPFAGTAFTLIACPVAPAVSVVDMGVTLSEKSAAGEGGLPEPVMDTLLQDTNPSNNIAHAAHRNAHANTPRSRARRLWPHLPMALSVELESDLTSCDRRFMRRRIPGRESAWNAKLDAADKLGRLPPVLFALP